jgi:hypothetical protein
MLASSSSSSSPTSDASIDPAPEHTSHTWIAGTVVGPILLLLVIGFGVFWIRRRKNTRGSPVTQEDGQDESVLEQAQLHADHRGQLHSDSIASPQRHELEGNVAPTQRQCRSCPSWSLCVPNYRKEHSLGSQYEYDC